MTVALYLLRHGDAASGGCVDEERPLSARGRREIVEVARALVSAGGRLERVIASPLVRAQETAQLLVEGLLGAATRATDDRLEPGRNPPEMLAAARAHVGAGGSLALVGHEPSMGDLLASLTGRRRFAFAKGQLVRLDWAVGAASATAVWTLSPGRLTPQPLLD